MTQTKKKKKAGYPWIKTHDEIGYRVVYAILGFSCLAWAVLNELHVIRFAGFGGAGTYLLSIAFYLITIIGSLALLRRFSYKKPTHPVSAVSGIMLTAALAIQCVYNSNKLTNNGKLVMFVLLALAVTGAAAAFREGIRWMKENETEPAKTE